MISVAHPSYLYLFVGEWTYGVAGSNVLNEKDDYLFTPSRKYMQCMEMLGVKWDSVVHVPTYSCPNLTGKNV